MCVCVCVCLNVVSDFYFLISHFYILLMYIKLHYVCVVRRWFINIAIKLITVIYIYIYVLVYKEKTKIIKYHRVFVCNDYCAWAHCLDLVNWIATGQWFFVFSLFYNSIRMCILLHIILYINIYVYIWATRFYFILLSRRRRCHRRLDDIMDSCLAVGELTIA